MNTLSQGTETGGTETYEFLCITTASSTENCQCYRKYVNKTLDKDPSDLTITNCCNNENIADDLKRLIKCP